MWRPTQYGEEDFAAFREAMEGSAVEAVMIHMIYLINCATKDKEMRRKSLDSLTHALRVGDGIGAAGRRRPPRRAEGRPADPSLKRASKVIKEALEGNRVLPALLEKTAGRKGCSAATSTRPPS